jgi:hypothetical protein
MTPALSPAIAQAAQEFAKPAVRAQVLKWHNEGKPLLDMADELGITFTGELRALIAGLTAKEVATIRDAMIAAIGNDSSVMPIDCDIDDPNDMPKAIAVSPGTSGAGDLVAKVVRV